MNYLRDPALGRLLATFCRDSQRRLILSVDDDHPHRFFPHAVYVPETGERFSEAGAWELIADLIEAGHAIRIVPLKIPIGGFGYQMKVKIDPNRDELYVKLTFNRKNTKVIGRSFHYTD